MAFGWQGALTAACAEEVENSVEATGGLSCSRIRVETAPSPSFPVMGDSFSERSYPSDDMEKGTVDLPGPICNLRWVMYGD
jgi:hypothetical protein